MAHGEAALGLISIAEQAGCKVVGVGAVVEKVFQGGGDRIRNMGLQLESLAMVSGITEDGTILFANDVE